MDYSTKEASIEYLFEKAKNSIWPSEKNNYTCKLLQGNFLLYIIIFLLAVKILFSVVSVQFPKNIFFADITKTTLDDLANQSRVSAGLPLLTDNAKLDQAAQLKAENMVQNNYFNHTSPTGITPWYWFSEVGYNYKYAGENLAVGFYDSDEVYNAWMNSPEHKANLLNPNYQDVGTAIVSGFGSNNATIVVQLFGSQLPVTLPPAKPSAPKVVNSTISLSPSQPVGITPTTQVALQTPTNGGKVLAQSTEAPVLEIPQTNTFNTRYLAIVNSLVYNYASWLNDILYGIFVVVMGVLLAIIFFNFRLKIKRPLVYRSVIIVVLLVASIAINKDIIISIIPHQIIIQ